jgi:molybdate transport system permease protein
VTLVTTHTATTRNQVSASRRLPLGVPFIAGLGLAFLALPVFALLARVPWGEFGAIITKPETLQAAGLSLATAAAAAALCAVLGTSMALWIAELSTRWATITRVFVMVPLVMPPLVAGVALLAVLGQQGLLGPILVAAGIRIPFTSLAVILAQTFVALPFMVITVEAALLAGGPEYSVIASSLGASRSTVLRRITLPLLRPALVAGTLLCFARALGEYGATALFAGSSPGTTRTVTQTIAAAFQGTAYEEQLGYALAGLLVLIAIGVVAATGLWRGSARRQEFVR